MELANNTGSEVNLNYRDLSYLQRVCKTIDDPELYAGITEGFEQLKVRQTDVIAFSTETILTALYTAARTHPAIRATNFISARGAQRRADRLVQQRMKDIPAYS